VVARYFKLVDYTHGLIEKAIFTLQNNATRKIVVGQARPQKFLDGARPSFRMGGEQYIIGGTDASPGEFPWQLSQTRGGSHSCGASLLNALNGLSAGHCVDGA